MSDERPGVEPPAATISETTENRAASRSVLNRLDPRKVLHFFARSKGSAHADTQADSAGATGDKPDAPEPETELASPVEIPPIPPGKTTAYLGTLSERSRDTLISAVKTGEVHVAAPKSYGSAMWGRTPFAEPLAASTIDKKKIKQIESDENKLVRVEHVGVKPEELERYKTGKRVVSELHDKYGVNVPPFDVVIGPDTTYPSLATVYTVIERVNGQSLKDATFTDAEKGMARQDFDAFFATFFHYLEAKYQSREPFFSDIKNDQFVYGNRPHEFGSKKIYLVDVEPFYATVDKPSHNNNGTFTGQVAKLSEMMREMEQKLGGEPLPAARARFREMLTTLGPNNEAKLDTEAYLKQLDEESEEPPATAT